MKAIATDSFLCMPPDKKYKKLPSKAERSQLREHHIEHLNGFQIYTVKPKIIQTPDIIFYIFLLVGAGHYSSFMQVRIAQ